MVSEKRLCELPKVRVTETLEQALMRLAATDDRSLSDYVRRVLELHAFGHVAQSASRPSDCQRCVGAQCDPR